MAEKGSKAPGSGTGGWHLWVSIEALCDEMMSRSASVVDTLSLILFNSGLYVINDDDW